jgi:hypothetical protein
VSQSSAQNAAPTARRREQIPARESALCERTDDDNDVGAVTRSGGVAAAACQADDDGRDQRGRRMIGRHIEPHTRRAIRRSGRQFVRGGGEGITRRCGDLSSPESEQFVSDWTYYDRKVAEGMAHTSALRALKCRISDALYAQLIADQQPTTREADQDPGGQSGNDSASSAAGSHPEQPALRTSHSRAGTHSRISHRFTEPVLTRRPALLGADQAAGQPKRHFPAQEQATTASTPDTKRSRSARVPTRRSRADGFLWWPSRCLR